jgi:hypothetical protein
MLLGNTENKCKGTRAKQGSPQASLPTSTSHAAPHNHPPTNLHVVDTARAPGLRALQGLQLKHAGLRVQEGHGGRVA